MPSSVTEGRTPSIRGSFRLPKKSISAPVVTRARYHNRKVEAAQLEQKITSHLEAMQKAYDCLPEQAKHGATVGGLAASTGNIWREDYKVSRDDGNISDIGSDSGDEHYEMARETLPSVFVMRELQDNGSCTATRLEFGEDKRLFSPMAFEGAFFSEEKRDTAPTEQQTPELTDEDKEIINALPSYFITKKYKSGKRSEDETKAGEHLLAECFIEIQGEKTEHRAASEDIHTVLRTLSHMPPTFRAALLKEDDELIFPSKDDALKLCGEQNALFIHNLYDNILTCQGTECQFLMMAGEAVDGEVTPGKKLIVPSKDKALALCDKESTKQADYIQWLYSPENDRGVKSETVRFSLDVSGQNSDMIEALNGGLTQYETIAKEKFGAFFNALENKEVGPIVDQFVAMPPKGKGSAFIMAVKNIMNVLPDDYVISSVKNNLGGAMNFVGQLALKKGGSWYVSQTGKNYNSEDKELYSNKERFEFKIDQLKNNKNKLFKNLAYMLRLRDSVQKGATITGEEKEQFISLAKSHFDTKFNQTYIPEYKTAKQEENETNISNYYLTRFSDEKFLGAFCDFLNLVMPKGQS